MGDERVSHTSMSRPVGVETILGEELLTARAEGLVDGSAYSDVGRARGWVGGTDLAALVRSAPKSEQRSQGDRNPRDRRQVDQSANQAVDSRAIHRAHDRAEVAFELAERRRVHGVVRTDGDDDEVRPLVEHRGQLPHQDVLDAGTADRVARQMEAAIEARRGVGDEHFACVFQARTGQGAVADDRDTQWVRGRVTFGAVVPGRIEIFELRKRSVRGTVHLHP